MNGQMQQTMEVANDGHHAAISADASSSSSPVAAPAPLPSESSSLCVSRTVPLPSRRLVGGGLQSRRRSDQHDTIEQDGGAEAETKPSMTEQRRPSQRRASGSAALTQPQHASSSSSGATVPNSLLPSSSAAGAPLSHRNLTRFLHTELGGSVMLNRLRSGGIFLKHGSRGAPHFRFVCCSADLSRVTWTDLKAKKMATANAPPASSFVLSDSVLAVTPGHATRVLRERAAHLKDSDPARCLSLTTTMRTLDLECVSEQERDLWLLTFAFLVDYTQKRKAAGIKKQQRQTQDKQTERGLAPAAQPAAAASTSTSMVALPGFELDGVAHGELSLVHALQLLCDRSIGRAHAQNQSQSQTQTRGQTTKADAAAEGAHTDGATHVAQSHPHSTANDDRSLLQSPLVAAEDERADATPPVQLQSPTAATVDPHSKDQMNPSKADSFPLRSDQEQQQQQSQMARQTHENDATLRIGANAAPAATAPSVVPGSEDKAQPPSLQQQQQQQPQQSFGPPPPQLPTPPDSHHEHVATANGPCGAMDARATGAAPLPSVPSAESILIAARDRVSRELECARDDNRSLYIHSARKMIELQHKIDALTRENIDLIRLITTQRTHY